MDRKKDYLVIIQGVIFRMANNSFLLKGWSATLVAALITLAARESSRDCLYVALIPVINFWFLDAYYLRLERLFRHLYNRARLLEDAEIDYSLDTSLVREKEHWIVPIGNGTLVLFYGTLLASIVVGYFALPRAGAH